VSVLFADIKGSMELLAGRDPEDARRLIDPVLAAMMDAVHHYEGTVNQVLGDGIMALFGAPIAHEDHALRACCAALRMQRAVAALGPAPGADPRAVEIRVGISSGEVLTRTIAADLDTEYTAVGETTHLAARLQELAPARGILCAGSTVSLARAFIEVRARGPTPIRGLATPVEVFELLGADPARLRFRAAAARGLAPLVGRRQELAAIRLAQARAAGGEGQVVALVGEPGIGKSRLLHELTREMPASGWRILETGGLSHGTNVPYLPIVAMLRRYFGVQDGDDPGTVRERIDERLRAIDPALALSRPAFQELLGDPTSDPAWRVLEPAQRRLAINRAIIGLLVREARERPLAVVVEDLHWIDHQTRAVLDGLVAELAGSRLLVLVSYRPDLAPESDSAVARGPVRIGPLAEDEAVQLVRRLLGDDPRLGPLETALVTRAGGNPFFLEEGVRALAEAGVLAGETGAYRLAKDPDRIRVPVSVQAVLAARIDRLAPGDKRLLQIAAVIGSEFAYPVLRRMAGESDEALRTALDRLQGAGFIDERPPGAESGYAFTHALTHEVAYGGLLHERRAELHGRVVGAMEALYGPRLSEHVDRLAYHAQRAEAWEQAAAYATEAGAHAADRSAYREAVAYFEQALGALERLAPSADTLGRAIDLRFQLRNALLPLGEIRRDLEHLRAAERLAVALGDRRRRARLSASIARDLSLLGHPAEAIEAGTEALALATEIADAELQVLTEAYLGLAHYSCGDYPRAVAVLRRTVSALAAGEETRRFGLPGPGAVFFRAWLVWSLARRGDFAAAGPLAAEAIAIAERVGQPLAIVVARYTLGFLAMHRGDLAAATEALESAMELCRAWGFPAWIPNIASALGYAHALGDRVEQGTALLRQAVEQTAATGNMVRHASEVAMLAEARLLAGCPDEAAPLAVRAVELARSHGERGNEAAALRLLGEIAAARQPPDREAGERNYRDALALARECGTRPLIGQCALGLARLFHRLGRPSAAAGMLDDALATFRELRMPYWRDQAETLRTALGRAGCGPAS
jgi:class 3 adenylate cyclase/tetratricopeptide (TPR) repeat protein